MAPNLGAMTVAEFRKTYNVTAAQWSGHVRAGTAPPVTLNGRTKFISLETAQAWQAAEGQRVVEALNFWAGPNADEPEGGA
jgi:hypothetical protein